MSAFHPLRTSSFRVCSRGRCFGKPLVSAKQSYLVFTWLYLLSFAVLVGFVVLLIVGIFQPEVMPFVNRIALPTLLASIFCLELFKRLGRRAEKRLQR